MLQPNPKIVRAYDIRGVAETDLPAEVVENIAHAHSAGPGVLD